MKAVDLVRSAAANTVRSRLRTTLTVLALSVGAFTLTITTALGQGVSSYIDAQVATLGSDDVVLVQLAADPADALAADDGPAEYEEGTPAAAGGLGAPPGFGGSDPLSAEDLDRIAGIDGIAEVEPVRAVAVDYVEGASGTRYVFTINPQSAVTRSDLEAGAQLDHTADDYEVVLPSEYLEPLGYPSADEAVGETVTIAATDAAGAQQTLEATLVGVSRASLLASGAGANNALIGAIADLQSATAGAAEDAAGASVAIAYLDDGADGADLDAVRSALADGGYSAQTVEDQLGIVQTVIIGITGVLNAFGVIALLAAAFGIVNTLLMSVQERTREIGLMKAMGMSSGRVFALFSLEAVVIGLLGSALGVLLGVGAGSALSAALGAGPLAGLEGLTLLAFDPLGVLGVVVLITAIAFVSGTLPAARAARQRPIESLRYE
ncbi:FtsX-like permease family protein [Microcella daejeonensis]|uniref:FtsX-like permease family protein n=1 Tax=Microcella daejeonensis TaxID=2994971 RepID=A0A9E8ML82_9MICO|nr:ABC transporter permease [Microcella daejeonensis]WAB81558.1 FtsX-like permease family protein [Microcella daejeonensis]WAB83705.1 FtsX-like permease family protein [Microcella daejeonensis]